MSDLDALLAEIIAHPAEDTPRLAYADCLEERGEPGDAARAEFVRVQVELAGRAVTGDDRARADNIARRVRKRAPAPLRAKTTAVLLAREKLLLGGTHPPPVGVFEYSPYVQWFTGSFMTAMAMLPVFRRGFVDEVTCTAEDWLRHGRDARRLHPITRVNLTTVPDHSLLSKWCDGARTLVVVHGLNTNVPLREPPTPERLRDYVLHILSAEFPGVAFTLPQPLRPVAAALEQITGRRANAVTALPSWEGMSVSGVRELPRTGWVARGMTLRPVESPPAVDPAARTAAAGEWTVREWRFTVEAPAAITGAQLGVPFGPVEGVDRDGRAWVADRVVLTDATELPGGVTRYTATAHDPPRRA